MKTVVKVDSDGLADECPKCLDTENLCICNDDGIECMSCGCWFSTDDSGSIIWAYNSHPIEVF